MDKQELIFDLHLNTTESQSEKLNALLEELLSLCKEVDAAAPAEIKKYKPLCDWAYPYLRKKKVYSVLISRVVGKVSRSRLKGLDYDGNFLLFDKKSFRLDGDVLKLRLLKGYEHFTFHLNASDQSRSIIDADTIQSGTLQKCDNCRFVFKLKVKPKNIIRYNPS